LRSHNGTFSPVSYILALRDVHYCWKKIIGGVFTDNYPATGGISVDGKIGMEEAIYVLQQVAELK
jgi:hypothetical protein